MAWGKVDNGTNFRDKRQFTVTEKWEKAMRVIPTKRTVNLHRHPDGRKVKDFTLNRQNLLTAQGLDKPATRGRRVGFTPETSSPVPSESKETNCHETKRDTFINSFQANDIKDQDQVEVEDQMVYSIEPEGYRSTFSCVSSYPMWYQSSAFFGFLVFLASAVFVLYTDEIKNWIKGAVGLKPEDKILNIQANAKENENLESKTPVTSANLETLLNLLIAHKSKKISQTAALHI